MEGGGRRVSIRPRRPRVEPADASGVGAVVGIDDRRRVVDTTVAPWRSISALRITTSAATPLVATGWLISPRVVTTAGHCVFRHDDGGWVSEVVVIPALNGSRRPLASARSARFCSTVGFTKSRGPDHDY